MTIVHDSLFEGLLQNYYYVFVRANNVVSELTIADFPLMNLNDLIQVAYILKNLDAHKLQNTSKDVLKLGLGHIKLFIDNYYDCLAMTDVELVATMEKELVAPKIKANK